MAEEEGKKTEKELLEVLVDDLAHKIMGKSLDLMRTSGMSDRSLLQATRSLKDFTNELSIKVIEVLKEKNYIKKD